VLNSKSDRAPTPGRSQQPDPGGSIAPKPGDGLAFRLKTAVWAWRLRVPRGPAGHRYLAALERALAAHAARNMAAMLAEGWAEAAAYAAYREWLHDLVDTALADGWRAP
jgi:hypothetical protein